MNLAKKMSEWEGEKRNPSGLNKLEFDKKLLKSIREDSVDEAAVQAELDNLSDDSSDSSDKAFRKRLAHLLESKPLEIFLVVLVVIDVIALLIMLVMDLNVFQIKLRDEEQRAEKITNLLKTHCLNNTELSEYHGANLETVSSHLTAGGCMWLGKDDDTLHSRHKRAVKAEEGANPTVAMLLGTSHILHYLSIVILGIMLTEVLLKMFALGRKYFRGKLEVVDGIVIIISFTMDLYFIDGISSAGFENAASLLVIFLLWRILRVFNALLVTAKKRLQFRIQVQKRMRRTLEVKCESLREENTLLEKHISNLEAVARRHPVPEFEIIACKPLRKTNRKVSTSAGLASMMQMSMGLMSGMNNVNRSLSTPDRKTPLLSEEGELQTVSSILYDAVNTAKESDNAADHKSCGDLSSNESGDNHKLLNQPDGQHKHMPAGVKFVEAVGLGDNTTTKQTV